CHFSKVWREAAIGVEHGRDRAVPIPDAFVAGWQRRIAVPGIELVLTEPPGLHLVVAMRETRIGRLYGSLQRIDDFAFDGIGHVTAVGDVLITTPAIGDFLVL